MNASDTCLIVANGDITDLDWLREECRAASLTFAADGGTDYLFAIGILPHGVVGDVDSASDEAIAWVERAGVPIERHSAEKDQTDLELAIDTALEKGVGAIRIAGAWGGRADQTVANLLMLARPEWVDVDIAIIRPNEHIFVSRSAFTVVDRVGDTLSLLPLTADVVIGSTVWLKWALQDSHLQFGYARGVSNKITSNHVSVAVTRGIVACFVTLGTWQR